MVREDISLFGATQKLELGIRPAECDNIVRTKRFQEILREERNKHYKELADDPSRTKRAAVGRLVFIIEQLIEKQQYEKASAAIMQLAKLEGWTDDKASINVFNDLSAKDLEALRSKFKGVTLPIGKA